MIYKAKLSVAASVALLLISVSQAWSATVYSDRTSFEAAAGTLNTEDFAGYGGSGCNAFQNIPAIDCGSGPSTLDFVDFSVEAYAQPYIAPGELLLDPDLHLYVSGGEALQIGGHAVQFSNFQTTSTWSFGESLNAFAADTNMFDGMMSIALFDDGAEIFSFDITNPVSGDPYFFGVISDLSFNQIVIQQERLDTMEYDNITFQPVAAVPLPAALPLFLTGLAMFTGGLMRRRHI
jgi:hypothetical protein